MLCFAMTFSLLGCCLQHDWKEATCTEPKTCAKCGKTEGESNGHSWISATVKEPKTCRNCGITEGEPLKPHYFDMTFADYMNKFNREYSGTFSIENTGSGFKLNLLGSKIKIILFNCDEFDKEQTSAAYSSEEHEKWNDLTIRYVASDSSYNTDNLSVMCALIAKCAQVLDPNFSETDFQNNLTFTELGYGPGSCHIDYSNNGFDIKIIASDGSVGSLTSFYYDASITLSANN